MNMIDVLKKIDELRKEKGWSIYKLAEESNLTQSTLANMFRRKSIPSLKTLEQICDAFGISLSEFFSEKNNIDYETAKVMDNFKNLKDRDKEIIKTLITEMKKHN